MSWVGYTHLNYTRKREGGGDFFFVTFKKGVVYSLLRIRSFFAGLRKHIL